MSLSSLAPRVWEFILNSTKNVEFSEFKNQTKACATDKYPFRPRKKYVGRVGFI